MTEFSVHRGWQDVIKCKDTLKASTVAAQQGLLALKTEAIPELFNARSQKLLFDGYCRFRELVNLVCSARYTPLPTLSAVQCLRL